MKYKHRIIPGHMGGTYVPENVVLLTIEEHAEAHKKLWEEHGRWQDELAWKMLSGQIGKEEGIRQAQRMGQLGRKHSSESKQKMALAKIGTKHHLGFTQSDSCKEKMRAAWTEERKCKVGEARRGKPFTEQHKMNLRLAKQRKKIANGYE